MTFNCHLLFAQPIEKPDKPNPKNITISENEDFTLVAFNNLLKVMEETTEIATKTKLNSDFVPGMVTVLNSDQLESLGVSSVLEALNLLPGVTTMFYKPVFHGVQQWGSGKIKILLNGVSVNHTLTAIPNPPFAIPIEMVERIEVIQGPGASLYGEYAYGGVVNIVTKTRKNQIHGRLANDDYFANSCMFSYENPKKDLLFNLNFGGYKTNGEEHESGKDILYSEMFNQGHISNAPGTLYERSKQTTGILTFKYKNFSLLGQYLEGWFTEIFGTSDVLPPDDRYVWDESLFNIEASYHSTITSNTTIQTKILWQDYILDMENNPMFPPGFFSSPPSLDDLQDEAFPFSFKHFHPEGITVSSYGRENRFLGSIWLNSKHFKNHQLDVGLEYTFIKLIDSWSEANADPFTLERTEKKRDSDDKTWIKKDVTREVISFVLQDQIKATNKLHITGGFRIDHYDDVGTAFTPRLASVYHMNDNNVLKAQYSKAFRPPTFMELYSRNFVIMGNTDIDPETVDTYEIAYLFRNVNTRCRLTIFHSAMDKLIMSNSAVKSFDNGKGATLTGTDVEVEKALTPNFKINANVSYVKTKDKALDSEIEGSANWTSDIWLIYKPFQKCALSLNYAFIGERNRAPLDTREKIDCTNLVNFTANFKNLLRNGLLLQFGAKNIFDSKIIEPAVPNTYPDDYPRPGRQLWTKISYTF